MYILITSESLSATVGLLKNKILKKQEKTSNSYMELPQVAFLLALVAGTMDGYAFFTTGMFATFQTGNVVLAAFNFVNYSMISMLPMLTSILAFGIGVVFVSYYRNHCLRKMKIWTFKVLAIEIALFFIILLDGVFHFLSPLELVYLMSFVAGVQGNTFYKLLNMLYANIAVTLDVQLIFGYFADGLLLKDKRREFLTKAVSYLMIFIGFMVGASTTVILIDYIGVFSLFIGILSLVGIYIVGRVMQRKMKISIDIELDD